MPDLGSVSDALSTTDLAKLAEDASVLLEFFSKTLPSTIAEITTEQREMVRGALTGLVSLHSALRGSGSSMGGLDGTMVDAACVICYSEIADMVLAPCMHLAMCMV